MTFELHPTRHLKIDLFPSLVSKGDEPMPGKEYRTVVTDNRLYVLDDSPEGPISPVNEELVSLDGDYAKGFTVTTTEGVYTVTRAGNCGCGSRLRGYGGFHGISFEARFPGGA